MQALRICVLHVYICVLVTKFLTCPFHLNKNEGTREIAYFEIYVLEAIIRSSFLNNPFGRHIEGSLAL